MKNVLLSLAAVFALTACGGGGGGGSSAPVATPLDARVSIDSITPAVGSTAVAVDSPITVRYTVLSGTFDVIMLSGAKCGGVATSMTVTSSPGTTVFTSTRPAPNDASCTGTIQVFALGVNGGRSATAAANFAHTTMPAPAAWYKGVTVIPEGKKETGVNQLPADCTSQSQACWRESVLSGLAKTVASGLVYNGRKINFVVYIGSTGFYSRSAIFADDFTAADSGSIQGGGGGMGPASWRLIWFIGTTDGFIYQIPGDSTCGLWKPDGLSWNTHLRLQ